MITTKKRRKNTNKLHKKKHPPVSQSEDALCSMKKMSPEIKKTAFVITETDNDNSTTTRVIIPNSDNDKSTVYTIDGKIVLGYLYGICTPRGNHFATRTYKPSF